MSAISRFPLASMIVTGALNPQPGSTGLVTVSLTALSGLITNVGQPPVPRACQDGDVLSVQANGTLEGRPAGTAGPYELAILAKNGDRLIYNIVGRVYSFAYEPLVPNL